jgi:homoserine dehydrogenase
LKEIKVGLLGLGTVGGGVAKIMHDHAQKMSDTEGISYKVAKIFVRDIEKSRAKHPGLPEEITLTTDFNDVINDPEIDIVVEVMGGTSFAADCIEAALRAGKHIVTANKDLIAIERGQKLIQYAAANQLDFLYEAAVAGGIPILNSLRTSLASDKLSSVSGIVNGTTNYILTKMYEQERNFDEVLAEAQALGLAEADPSGDVDGFDAARKMVILTKMAFGVSVDLDKIPVKGIRHVKSRDIQVADQLGYVIKLIGTASFKEGTVYASVAPTLVPKTHPLSTVRNEMNAVFTSGAATGEMMFYGPGAGELPTGAMVVSDIMAIGQHIETQTTGHAFANYSQEATWREAENIESVGFFHFVTEDKQGQFLKLVKIFDDTKVSLDKVFQEPKHEAHNAEIVVVTHEMSQAQLAQIQSATQNSDELSLVSYYAVMADAK